MKVATYNSLHRLEQLDLSSTGVGAWFSNLT